MSSKDQVRDFLFYDRQTGEEFFVETTSPEEAQKIAHQYFENPRLIDVYSVAEADILGYDTY